MQNLVTIGSKGAWLRMREFRRQVTIFSLFSCARLQTSPLDRPTPLIAQTKRPDAGHIRYMFSIIF